MTKLPTVMQGKAKVAFVCYGCGLTVPVGARFALVQFEGEAARLYHEGCATDNPRKAEDEK